MSKIEITRAESEQDLAEVKALFVEYADTIRDGPCDHNLGVELDNFPADYVAPKGLVLLARLEGAAAGAVGYQDGGEGGCEMKRLYARPEARGQGVGRGLVERLIEEAAGQGFETMSLQTLTSMADARIMYRRFGFRVLNPENTRDPNRIWNMELKLQD